MKINILRFFMPLLCLGFSAAILHSCSQDDAGPGNPTNGKTTAVFNPSVTYGSLTDQEGNTYKTITVNGKTWMAENLRTTRYNDGTPITLITDNISWGDITAGAYSNHFNTENIDTIATYGRLYNWYAVNTGKLCPLGWHVPDINEWSALADAFGGAGEAGGALKEVGTTHWASPNTGATNESGFTAIPGGYRDIDGTFHSMSISANWWGTTEFDDANATFADVGFSVVLFYLYPANKKVGACVRCVKD